MPGPVQSIERAAAILRLLARGSGRLGVGEISTSLGLAKGTTHGILRTLQDVGFVEQDKASGKYQLGATLLHLGTSYLDVNELRSRAINWADALASRSGEAVRIGTPLDGKVLVVHHVFRPDDSLQTLDIGTLLPVHATALGKVLLAYDSRGGRRGRRRSDWSSTPGARSTTPAAMRKAVAEVREQGWAPRPRSTPPVRPRSPPPSAGTVATWSARSASPGGGPALPRRGPAWTRPW